MKNGQKNANSYMPLYTLANFLNSNYSCTIYVIGKNPKQAGIPGLITENTKCCFIHVAELQIIFSCFTFLKYYCFS